MAQRIERVGVLGAGLMGHGITQVAAQSGYEVVVREVDQATLEKGIGRIEKQLARAGENQKAGPGGDDAVRARNLGRRGYRCMPCHELWFLGITQCWRWKVENGSQ